MRKMLFPETEEVTGGKKKSYSEDLHDFNSEQNIITDQLEDVKMGRVCGTHVGGEECIESCGVEM
jgi:hypothetical protein